jgi:glycosyltransferase involved in cell wall biosynthesis
MTHLTPENVCVVIPAHNEEKTIAPIIQDVRRQGYAVVVVDDSSDDRTAETSRAAGAIVLQGNRRQGKGASLRRGFNYCLGSRYAAVITMDADGQHDPEELDRFLQALNQNSAGIIIGSRMSSVDSMPWVRHVTNRLMSALLSFLVGQYVPDSQCGYRGVRTEVLQRMSLRTAHYEIESEMVLEADRLGLAIDNIPVQSVYEGSKSEISPARDTIRFITFLARYLYNHYNQHKHKNARGKDN